jgi:RNA recognition motif-containing protein
MMEGEAPSRDIVSPEEQQHQQNGTPTENGAAVIGSAAMRPIFLGNLNPDYTAADVTEMFERPLVPKDLPQDAYPPMPVERVDVKRGYCFVFLKDAQTQQDKEAAERFVSDINGM